MSTCPQSEGDYSTTPLPLPSHTQRIHTTSPYTLAIPPCPTEHTRPASTHAPLHMAHRANEGCSSVLRVWWGCGSGIVLPIVGCQPKARQVGLKQLTILGELAQIALVDLILRRHVYLHVRANEDKRRQVRGVHVRVGESPSE